jgi:hypothetical protein
MGKNKPAFDYSALKKDPKYAGMTKKKIKKSLRSENKTTPDRAAKLNIKRKKESVKQSGKSFTRALKKDFIVHGLTTELTNEAGPQDHGDKPYGSRYLPSRKTALGKLEGAPSVVIDLDFSIFKDKNVSSTVMDQFGKPIGAHTVLVCQTPEAHQDDSLRDLPRGPAALGQAEGVQLADELFQVPRGESGRLRQPGVHHRRG